MSRLLSSLSAATAFSMLFTPCFAASSSISDEVHELRRDLQMQGKKIDALTQTIADLTAFIKQREEAKTNREPSATAATPVAVAETSEAKPASGPAPEAPKATPVPAPPTISHVVAKGETLTSIAKQYNVNLSDLLKLNKNTNDRKLQIGQTLKVPAIKPAEAASAEAPTATAITP